MSLPTKKIIRKVGKDVEVVHPSGGGGRSFPTETSQGTVRMVVEQRGMAKTVTDSSGTDHEVDIEFRAVPGAGDPEISGPGEGDVDGAVLLNHPDIGTFRVVRTFVEDVDVLVINAVED